MKKILTLLAIALASLTSCKEELVQYSISVDPVELSFNSAGGEDTVYVTSSAEWELFSDSGWCHASSAGGNGDTEIVITVLPNEDSKSGRTATFTFVSGDKEATLTVTQEKKEYSISIEPTELIFGAEGGEQEVVVTSSDEWEVTGSSDWCDVSVSSGINGDTVKFSTEPYMNTEEARTAIYTFACGDKEAVLDIQQEAKVYSISVEPTELTFVAAGEEKSVTVTSSDEWEFSSDDSWISASKENGESGVVVGIIVEENENTEIRTGVATFKCGDKQADVKVTQEAKEFSISIEPTEIEFEAEGGEQTITVKSSDEWRLTTDDDWITASVNSGNDGSTVDITVGYTTSADIRTGVVTFICGNKTAEFVVKQNPDNSPIIQFKDPYFLEALLLTEQVDKNGDRQISEKEALSITELKLEKVESGHAVRNVEELSYFTSLKYLYLRDICQSTVSINANGFPALQKIQFINIGLDKIDFSDCPLLEDVHITGYSNNIDLSGCQLLKTVSLGDSKIIDLNGCKSIEELTMSEYSTIEVLDVSNCSSLKSLTCNNNSAMTSMNISNTVSLAKLECYNNGLTSLDLSDCTALEILNCAGNQLTTLDLSNNTALTNLSCNLTSLDLSNNTALTYLYCGSSQLTSLDLSNNTALTYLNCSTNQLTSLDLSNNTALTYLDCSTNQLTSLDLSNNTALTYLDCDGNQLTSLDLSNNTALEHLSCGGNQLTSLDLHNNRLLKSLRCDYTPLQKLILYKYHILSDYTIESIESEYGDIIEYME